MRARHDAAALVEDLYAAARRFGETWRARKRALLERCAGMPFDDRKALVRYHDCLLFLLAYPEDRALFAAAKRELARVARIARRVSLSRTRAGESCLFESGIAWSQTSRAFSYPVARWLALEHAAFAELDAGDADSELFRQTLALALPPIEYALAEVPQTIADVCSEAKGTGSATDLGWLVAQLERLPSDDRTRDHLFERLEIPIRLTPRDGPLSRTFARGPAVAAFAYARGLQRDIDVQRLTAQPLPPKRRLSKAERASAIDAGRGVLAMLGRETDVIARATVDGVESFDLERGTSVVLYAMPPEERFPIDTHVGFVAFKNAIPVAYGGGWPFLGTCKIGINVFEPFRGGESAYVFAQVLRTYAQRFEARRFLVEPYQIGEHNPEGVRSGAFWFYYRMGFRPLGSRHAALAEEHYRRMSAERDYRAPLSVMRRLSHADLELPVAFRTSFEEAWPDPAILSAAVTRWIAREFGGDRAAAQRFAEQRVARVLAAHPAKWRPAERAAFASYALLLAAARGLDAWTERERRDAVSVIRAKGRSDEAEFARRSTAHRALRRALGELASSVL